MHEFETIFNFYEDGEHHHTVETEFYSIQYFSNIDTVNQIKLYADIKGDYHKAYIQTRIGEAFETELNAWIDLKKYYDSNKINLIIILYPTGGSGGIANSDPVIVAQLAATRTYYTISIRYMGHQQKYWWTDNEPSRKIYTEPFQLFENTTIFAQGRTGAIESGITSLVLNQIDKDFTEPVINVSTTSAAESVVVTITNWGISDTREVDIIPLPIVQNSSIKIFDMPIQGPEARIDYTGPFTVDFNCRVRARSGKWGTFITTTRDIVNIVMFPVILITNSEDLQSAQVTINFFNMPMQEYRIEETSGSDEWLTYTEPITLFNNFTVLARSANDFGINSNIVQRQVTGLITQAPIIKADLLNNRTAYLIEIIYNPSSVQKLFRIGPGEWENYLSPFYLYENKTIFAKSVNAFGMESDTVQKALTGIEIDDPVISYEIVNQNTQANINIEYGNLFIKEYSLDNINWNNYTQTISIFKDIIVFARGFTAQNRPSNTISKEIQGISMEAPIISSSLINNRTTHSITISYNVFAIDKLYRINDGVWQTYSSTFEIYINATVYAKAVNAGGVESPISSKVLTGIEIDTPVISGVLAPDHSAVTITINFGNAFSRLYSYDQAYWNTYYEPLKIFTNNTTVYAKSQSRANQDSSIVSYTTSGIVIVQPIITIIMASDNSSARVSINFGGLTSGQYSFDQSIWNNYTAPFDVFENTVIFARGLTSGGQESMAYENITGIYIDTPIISVIYLDSNTKAEITISFGNLTTRQYSFDNSTWSAYTAPISVTENKTVYARGFTALNRPSVTVSEQITGIVKPVTKPTIIPYSETHNNLTTCTLNVSTHDFVSGGAVSNKQYRVNNGAWQNLTGKLTYTSNQAVDFKCTDINGTESAISSFRVFRPFSLPTPVLGTTVYDAGQFEGQTMNAKELRMTDVALTGNFFDAYNYYGGNPYAYNDDSIEFRRGTTGPWRYFSGINFNGRLIVLSPTNIYLNDYLNGTFYNAVVNGDTVYFRHHWVRVMPDNYLATYPASGTFNAASPEAYNFRAFRPAETPIVHNEDTVLHFYSSAVSRTLNVY